MEWAVPGDDMDTSIAAVEREDPSTSNLRGFLLFFFVAHSFFLLYFLYVSFDEVRIIRRILSSHPVEIAYHRIELMIAASAFVLTAIGLFLILVRDPRTRAWWIAVASISVALSVAHVWLVRELPHQHLRPVSDILVRHGFLGAVVWLAYWTLSARVKTAFGPHYSQPPVSYTVLGAITAVATLIVLLAIGAGSLV
jgi:hypothetical protein